MKTISDVIIHLRDQVSPLVSGEIKERVIDAIYDLKLINSEQARQTVKEYERWIPVTVEQPKGSPIVFMYSESNNEYSCSHFVLMRGGIPVTHWQPLVPPKKEK